eukprot:EG_transcript_30645
MQRHLQPDDRQAWDHFAHHLRLVVTHYYSTLFHAAQGTGPFCAAVPSVVAEFWPVTYRAFLPNASYHVMIISPDSQMNIDSSLFDVVQNLYGGLAVSELLASAFMVMLLAALTGLNTYTVLILPLTVLGVMLGSGLTPIFELMHIVWISLALLLMVPFFFYIASAVERWARCQFLTEALFARELHASQTADSILNHTLKNILSDAAA